MVAFLGRPPTLVDGRDDQALAAADVAGREDAGFSGGKVAIGCLYSRPAVPFDAQLFQ
jgi:hypothetical protein